MANEGAERTPGVAKSGRFSRWDLIARAALSVVQSLSVITAHDKHKPVKNIYVIVINLVSSKMTRAEAPVLPDDEKLRVAVAEHLDRLNIAQVGIDGDGTLWKTPEVYAAAIRDAVEILVDDSSNQQLIREYDDYLRMAIGKMRAVFKVNPLIMEYSTLAVAVKLGRDLQDERVMAAVERVRRIFSQDRFELFDGAREVLETLGSPVMYTHAAEEWTWRKVTETEIKTLLSDVVCMDVDRQKRDQWEGWLRERGIEPKDFLMVGDNFTEEILPILAMGGRAIFVDHDERFSKMIEKLKGQERHEELMILIKAVEARRFACVRRLDRVPQALLWMR